MLWPVEGIVLYFLPGSWRAVAIVVFVLPDLVRAERSVRDVSSPIAAPAFVRSYDMRALRRRPDPAVTVPGAQCT